MRDLASRLVRGTASRVGNVARFGRWGVLPHYLFAIVVVMTLVFATVLPINRLLVEGRREAEVRREIEAIKADSEALAQKIDELKDPAVIESEARTRLGLVRPGETPLIAGEGPLPDPAPAIAKPKPKPKPNPRPPTSTAKPKASPSPSKSQATTAKPKPTASAKAKP